MKVYIVSEGSVNTGYECIIRCICSTKELADKIASAFSYLNINVTEFEVIE